MSKKILVCTAWPYANGELHLGHIAGCYLPADIFARYHRALGHEVLMVSGSDQHGTPITIKADEEGVGPEVIAARYHESFLETWQQLGISFDRFTSTGTVNHAAVAGDIFSTLLKNGYIYPASMSQPWCESCGRYLPDRYIEGTCPNCGSTGARGDQCDQCGRPMNASELKEPRCRICETPPVFHESEHFFLKLSAFEADLLEWVKRPEHANWRVNVRNFTQRYLEDGLHDRAITRDIDWGVALPLPGYEKKRLYVWFEAVIGYLSASKEWAQDQGAPERWREFWQDAAAESYYFIGKDNIPFHTIIWPAMLMGYGDLNLPTDVPSNEYLMIEGGKLSTSKRHAIWVPDFLSRYAPDALRFALAVGMPETNDTDFSWREFVRRNNDELVATWGNLAHRVLTFVYKNFEGQVPEPGEIDAAGQALLKRAEETLSAVGSSLAGCHFRQAIREILALAQEANRYLDETAPWKAIKVDRQAAATSLYVSLSVIAALKTMFYPVLPHTSQRLHEYLGFAGKVEAAGWAITALPPGQPLVAPQALFTKLDDSVVEEENARMAH
jgi:methionyl-tRNA synthetase